MGTGVLCARAGVGDPTDTRNTITNQATSYHWLVPVMIEPWSTSGTEHDSGTSTGSGRDDSVILGEVTSSCNTPCNPSGIETEADCSCGIPWAAATPDEICWRIFWLLNRSNKTRLLVHNTANQRDLTIPFSKASVFYIRHIQAFLFPPYTFRTVSMFDYIKIIKSKKVKFIILGDQTPKAKRDHSGAIYLLPQYCPKTMLVLGRPRCRYNDKTEGVFSQSD